ncbi:MAG: sodium:proton antiporter [Gallionellaceae bacterium]|nr:sodium:proton antiporter [Gallionellaceae bacterium]
MSEFALLTLLIGALSLIAIGIGGLVLSRNLFRIVLALSLAEAGANLLLVLVGFRRDAIAPIIEQGHALTATMVDPIPQAMVLTAIVIGVGVQALALSLAIRAYVAYGTLDMNVMRSRMETDISDAAGAQPATSQHAPAGGRPLPPISAPRLAHNKGAQG